METKTVGVAERYNNREASWVDFNARVLAEAADPHKHPLLERAKFLAIFATNLDEFFMIRVSSLHEQIAAGVANLSPDGRTPMQVLDLVTENIRPDVAEHARLWREEIHPALAQNGVLVCDYAQLSDAQRREANHYFRREVFPILTPLAVDPGHPFPLISNLSLSLAITMNDKQGEERFARVKVPPMLPRFVPVTPDPPANGRDKQNAFAFVWLEQVIAANIEALFPGFTITGIYTFRVTRDSDVEYKEVDADDLLATIASALSTRRRGSVVRLEVAHDTPGRVLSWLQQHLEATEQETFCVHGPISLACLWELMRLPIAKLKDSPITPRVPAALQKTDEGAIFERLQESDVLLYHPYDSFRPVVDFITAAARDPLVQAIKMTLYRAGSNSPIVNALLEAVDNGKQVAVMVELKARFDEESNIGWAKALEEHGAHVVYGFPGLKVHSKIALVVRRESDGIRRYLHLGTGNYNASTARIYTDLGLLTAREDFGEDASDLFNRLTGYSYQTDYRRLLVAPTRLRPRLYLLIDREITLHRQSGSGHLIFKMNSLTDPGMIDKLYEASEAGVKVELIVRGMCCLYPGLPGMSDNIRVLSIIGRFLEHGRIYYFRNGGDKEIYIGSADLMQRNLDHRIETVFPILDPELRQHILDDVLRLQLADNVNAWELQPDGSYRRIKRRGEEPIMNCQAVSEIG
jgi:polyphosphate kinase